MVQSQPTKTRDTRESENPTHGSGWIVQSQPTEDTLQVLREIPLTLSQSHHETYSWQMRLEPLSQLNWAYQLHYYLCFRTYRRHALFNNSERSELLASLLSEVCDRHDYHLLKLKILPDNLRCLVSLRPNHVIAKVIQTVKANVSRELSAQFKISPPIWAGGYLANSVGRVRIDAVRRYLDNQANHHGYAKRLLPPVFRYHAQAPVSLKAAHSSFELNHHLVFATEQRRGVFDSRLGEALAHYWIKVAAKHGFAIDRVSTVPDHLHLMIRTLPRLSVESCALALFNNGQHFIAKNYPETLIRAKVERLWQGSAYAGTTGKMTTALLKSFMSH